MASKLVRLTDAAASKISVSRRRFLCRLAGVTGAAALALGIMVPRTQAAVDPECYSECYSSCASDCADNFVGEGRGECLRACMAECRFECS